MVVGYGINIFSQGLFITSPDHLDIDHRIEILSSDKDYNKVKLYENAEARYSILPSQAK